MSCDNPQCEACKKGRDTVLADVRESIAVGQWHVIGVMGEPTFTYTVGVWELFEHPEFIMVGIPSNLAGEILNVLAKRVKAGQRFADGELVGDLVADEIKLKLRTAKFDNFEITRGIMEDVEGEAPTYQVMWPDRSGYFPDDEKFSPEFWRLEPLA